ncbi:MAG TPA: response regulator [Iamia sp.]|nr:response regulator [Iamia sp.]
MRTDGTGEAVLVVDDEPQIRRALAVNLTARGYVVHQAGTGREALGSASAHHPDAVVLDLGLPDIDGIDVIRGLRGWSKVPIVILSVRDGERDKVEALDAGADDYVTKPFGMDELLARLRAALRRATPDDEAEPVVATAAFTVDLAAHTVVRDGRPVHLTPTAWGLVEILVRHPGRLVTREVVLRTVWGEGFEDESGYLRVHMASVRRKLEPDPAHPAHFLTEPRMGYRFVP